MIARDTAEQIDLVNGITLEIMAASFRTVRGYTLVAALCDEIAFWRSDESGANPDTEIISALRPAMATVPGAMLLCASSPYARRGALWNVFRKHFAHDSPVLVWRAPTLVMNATVPADIVANAYEDDAANAAAEYGGEFRVDVETFVSKEVIDAATMVGRIELPPMGGTSYVAFCDPSGGSSDSMTVAVAHRGKDGAAVLDVIRERTPPFSPDDTVREFAGVLKSYGITRVQGDRYGGEWPVERFRAHGVEYEASEKPKSDLYRELLPLLNSARVALLDHRKLINQLCGLERRTARSGRDSIDHAPGGHDDVANAVAGALVLAYAGGASLWERERLLINGGPAPLPVHPAMIFAVVIIGDDGREAGIAYFAAQFSQLGQPLHLLDCAVESSSSSLQPNTVQRLMELTESTGARLKPMLFTTDAVAQAFTRSGQRIGIEAIDGVLADEALPLSTAVHVDGGRVLVCAPVLGKRFPLPFLSGAAGDAPLVQAFMVGCSIALDCNRSLKRARGEHRRDRAA